MIKKIIRRIIRCSIKRAKEIHGQTGYFSNNVYVQGKAVLKDGDPINIADIYPDAQAKITGAINESDLAKALQSIGTDKILVVPDNPPNLDLTLSAIRDALRGADGRTLTDLYNKLGSISGSVSVANFPTDYPDSGTHSRLDDLKQALQSIGTDKFLTVVENFPTDYPDSGTHTRLDDLKQALQSIGTDKFLTAPDNPPNLDLSLTALRDALRGVDNRTLTDIYNRLGNELTRIAKLKGYDYDNGVWRDVAVDDSGRLRAVLS